MAVNLLQTTRIISGIPVINAHIAYTNEFLSSISNEFWCHLQLFNIYMYCQRNIDPSRLPYLTFSNCTESRLIKSRFNWCIEIDEQLSPFSLFT